MKNMYSDYLKQALAIYSDAQKAYELVDEQIGFGTVRPDNIKEGRIGFAFFMVELLATTKDQNIRKSIDREMLWLEVYAKAQPTNNYSLFEGRLSIGFLYLRLYECTKEQSLLFKAIAIVKEFYNSISFNNNIISKTGYFDGMTGVLSFTHRLYLNTGYPWLLSYIQKYTLAITSTCYQSDKGIFWGGVSNKENKNRGLANGTAGIAITLQQIGSSFMNTELQTIAAAAFEYEEWYLEEQALHIRESQVVGSSCYALSTGSLGIELALLHGNVNMDKSLERLTRFAYSIDEAFLRQFSATHSYGLFTGLSGVGVGLIEAAKYLDASHFIEKAQVIAQYLIEMYINTQHCVAPTLEGQLGIGYLCIRMAQMRVPASDLFFLPLMHSTPVASDLPLVFGEQNRLLLHAYFSSSYKKTLASMQAELPELYQEMMAIAQKTNFDEFASLLNDKLYRYEPADKTEKVKSFFENEIFKVSVIKKVDPADMYTSADIIEADKILQLDSHEFKQLQLERPRGAWMLCKNSFDPILTKFDNDSFLKFVQFYGTESSFYILNSLDKLNENTPGILQFICERFSTPKTVQEVIDFVTNFFLDHNSTVLLLMQDIFEATDIDALKVNLEAYIIEGAKFCISEGLLRSTEILNNKYDMSVAIGI